MQHSYGSRHCHCNPLTCPSTRAASWWRGTNRVHDGKHDAVFEIHTHLGNRRNGGRIVERLRNGGGRFTRDEKHSPSDQHGDDDGEYTDCYSDARPRRRAKPTPEPTSDVPPPWSWGQIDGAWCGASGTCQTIEKSTFTVLDELWVIQSTGIVEGCYIGAVTNRIYPGMSMMYCPAGVATPFTVFNSEATSSDETVMNDDASRERIWFYQGAGAETWFRQ
ncbi:hypothetical protein AB0N73_08250 [Microbacterium sp. NPDC089189]|uniref:hypothetical protein n=1 Tax=Microbacterium sp. NPDC089189 TaxID=3154972 RepID=UPI0034437844